MNGIGAARWRRWRRVLAGTIACLACLGAGEVAGTSRAAGTAGTATPVPSCPAGADQWAGPSGAWETAGNWSDGVPTSSEYVCVPATNVTITVSSTDTITGLLLGSGTGVDVQTAR